MRTAILVAHLFFAAALPSAPAAAAGVTYVVAEARSSVRVHVGKAGAFSFAGHRHEVQAPVSGSVTADADNLAGSRVELTFTSARLHVLPEGEPSGDVPKVEAVMRGAEVLDAARFPEIRFSSRQVTGRAGAAGSYDLSIVGDLSLHGVTRALTIPVKVTVEGKTLTASGRTTLRHDQFGMKPVSAAGGTVKVANEIGIDFRIVAEAR